MRKLLLILFPIAFAVVAYFFLPHGYSIPDIPPPKDSKNVQFYKKSGWQLLRYYYSLDNKPSVSIEFAKKLMRDHLSADIAITLEPFKEFPISGDFPSWFTPNKVQEGTLISGDDWIYAVVDSGSGHLYYYYGH